MGKLHTCYAPVRRSPSNKASFVHAAPRLACVKPIASVHPEPGSNSSLYIYFFIRLSLNSSFIVVKFFFSFKLSRFFLRSTIEVNFIVLAYRKNWRWYFLPCTYTTFLLFSIFQRTYLRFHRNGLQSYNIFLNRQNISKKIFIFFFSNFCSLTRRQPLSIADAKLLLFLKLPKYF